jgi:hypothetical protein
MADPWETAPLARGPESAGAFRTFGERLKDERAGRLGMSGKTLSFGVAFLDKALGGIFPHDLVLIGAKTGLGKTALASLIAITNALRGKRVHYFALEAEEAEIERRIKFAQLAKHMQRVVSGEHRRLNFLDWYRGRLDEYTAGYEEEIETTLGKAFKTLHTFYREREFYAESFDQMATEVQDETDLLVLDHLHYVDSEDPSENRGIKQIVKRVRDVALRIGKPVVLVAHIRKTDRRNPQIVPGLDDFMGSSDIPKIATKAVMIAPAYDQPSDDPCLWPTYLYPAKCRFDGTRTRYIGLTVFDARSNLYLENFTLGRPSIGGDEFQAVKGEEWPEWAKGGGA